ncbi:MAG: hypothetical protein M0005_03595 [Actinomycetota bacterium]|jgi:O-antigen/teichoic acid export membrane protein|nr:hypothetical protein [Actinomycetota bacterium]
MSTKFLTNLVIALFGGFIVVASLTFPFTTAAWLAFAFAIGVAAVTFGVQLDRSRGWEQRVIDAGMVAISAAMVVISLVYAGITLQWLVFALALGWVAMSVSGLTLHEVGTWRSERGLAELKPFVRTTRTFRTTQAASSQAAPGQAAVGSRIA